MCALPARSALYYMVPGAMDHNNKIRYFDNDQTLVLIRDDNYWGQDSSMWGSLPVPKHLAHNIFADNPASENALKAGQVDTDGDGNREYNGENIVLNAVCPNGWTDWQASMELVAAAGKEIGIDITTLYPEADIYYTVFTDPAQTEYAIFMWSPDASTPSNPWTRVNQFMGKDYVGISNNWSGNWGQYVNDEADALIKKIPLTTDESELKNLYTQLTEVPSFSLMYRPSVFHAVNESVWTNYPVEGSTISIGSASNVLVPPADCTDGFGIAALYQLELVG